MWLAVFGDSRIGRCLNAFYAWVSWPFCRNLCGTKVWFDDRQSLLARCLERSWCCIGCAVASPTWSPWARSGEASEAMRVARQIVGPMSALMWTFSMGHEHAAWAMTLGCAWSRQILKLQQTGIIDYFSLTKRARGYLFDVQKVSFSVINMFALCIYFRVHVVLPCQEQSKLVDWISRTISERQESIVEKEWSLWLFLYIGHMVWFLTSDKYQSSWRWLRTVMYGYLHMQSLFRTIGGVKKQWFLLTDARKLSGSDCIHGLEGLDMFLCKL